MAAYRIPPCPACGVWECLNCGARTSRRNQRTAHPALFDLDAD
jgi:hypothetical protein